MFENWVKATTTSTASTYTLTRVTGFPVPGDMFATNEPVYYMIDVEGGSNDGDREAGLGRIDASGNLVVDEVMSTWDESSSTYAQHEGMSTAPSAITKSGATTINVLLFPHSNAFLHGPQFMPSVLATNTRIVFSAHGGGYDSNSFASYGSDNRVYYTPFIVPVTVTTDACYIRCGSGGGDINVGFYTADRGGPNIRLFETGAWTPSAGSQNYQAWSGGNKTIRAGFYWVGLVKDGTFTMHNHPHPNAAVLSMCAGTESNDMRTGIRENTTGTTLPATAGTMVEDTFMDDSNAPAIGLRIV